MKTTGVHFDHFEPSYERFRDMHFSVKGKKLKWPKLHLKNFFTPNHYAHFAQREKLPLKTVFQLKIRKNFPGAKEA